MIRVAKHLFAIAIISYGILPMIKPIALWQQAAISFCLVAVVVGIELHRDQSRQQLEQVQRAVQRGTAHVAGSPASVAAQTAQAVELVQTIKSVMHQAAPVAPPTRPATVPARSASTPSKAAGFYAVEAAALTGLLQNHYKLNVVVEPKGFVKAPRFIAYKVTPTGPLQFAKLQKAENDLAREINDIHRNHRFGDVQIIFTDTQPIWLQISNPKPYPLAWADRQQLWQPKPLQAILGHYYDGAVAKPLVIDLRGKSSSFVNGGWFGQPGAGKSTDLHEALCSLLENTPPTALRFWGIDLAKDVFSRYVGLPHLAQHTSQVEEALAILQQFAEWCKAGNLPNDGVHRLLVIDEFQDLLTHAKYGKAALELMNDILSKGREFGIRVWMATQNPDAKCYPSDLKPKTHFMACCHILNDDYVSSELGIKGASKIVEKEELIFVGPVGTHRVSMFYFSEQDRDQMIERLIRKWGVATVTHPTTLPATITGRPSQAPVTTTAAPVAPAVAGLGPHAKWNLPNRALTPHEQEVIIQMVKAADPSTKQFHHRGKPTINKVIAHVYAGGKNDEKIAWVKATLIKGGLIEDEAAS